MWTDPEKYPKIADIDLAIQTVEAELMDELKLSTLMILQQHHIVVD